LFELYQKKKAENNKRFGDGEGILTSVCFLNLEEKQNRSGHKTHRTYGSSKGNIILCQRKALCVV
jgi:hypothetical protein